VHTVTCPLPIVALPARCPTFPQISDCAALCVLFLQFSLPPIFGNSIVKVDENGPMFIADLRYENSA
jgi:hypothetical protein